MCVCVFIGMCVSVHVHVCVCAHRAGATGPVLAGPIFVRKRGRVKLCTNAIMSVSMRKRRCIYAYTR